MARGVSNNKSCSGCGKALSWRNTTGKCFWCNDNAHCGSCGRKLGHGREDGSLCNSCTVVARNKEGWSEDQREKLSGENHYAWKSDEGLSYWNKHYRVVKARGPASDHYCVDCKGKAQEWSMIKGKDGSKPEHFEARCCSCHQIYDDHWNVDTRAKVGAAAKRMWTKASNEKRNRMLNPRGR